MQFKSDGKDTEAILVSFRHKAKSCLLSDPPSVIFRHRIPASKPTVMYLYIGAPVKEIIGKCHIDSTESVSLAAAKKLANDARIAPEELERYIGQHKDVSIYKISGITIFNNAIGLDRLRKSGRLFPPQSFLFLSEEGVAEINRLAK